MIEVVLLLLVGCVHERLNLWIVTVAVVAN